jgi:signal transduction histidine kinase
MASLRVRMATSYVLVTAAAVVVVEATMLVLLLSRTVGGSAEDLVQRQANTDAKTMSAVATKAYYREGGMTPDQALAAAAGLQPPGARLVKDGAARVRVAAGGDVPAGWLEAVVRPDGTVIASSARDVYPAGARIPISLPPNVTGASTITIKGTDVVWGVAPVILQDVLDPVTPDVRKPSKVPGQARVSRSPDTVVTGRELDKKIADGSIKVIGAVFVQIPKGRIRGDALASWRPLLAGGGVVLLLVLPVGVVFGMLSTRRLIRRVHRLAGMTASVAGGDFHSRVAVAGADEIGRLEGSVNRMAEQLDAALRTERRMAEAGARRTERARIARELHDSISQDLFSLSLLAGGLRRALPDGHELRTQASAMERTAGRTMREMQALLLELRPVALEDAGLAPAIDELCRAYETRLGIRVNAALEDVHLDPPAEHAVLRVTQEALGNAIKHGDPETIDVRLAGGTSGPQRTVTLEVRDDGCGFDPARVRDRHGMGLGLMRERVAELGGGLEVVSSPGRGTAVRVRLPAGAAP